MYATVLYYARLLAHTLAGMATDGLPQNKVWHMIR